MLIADRNGMVVSGLDGPNLPYDAEVEYLECPASEDAYIATPAAFKDFPNAVFTITYGLGASYSVNRPMWGSFASSSGGYNRASFGSSSGNWSVGRSDSYFLNLGTVDQARGGLLTVVCDGPNDSATCSANPGTVGSPLTTWNTYVREAIRGSTTPFELFRTYNTNPCKGCRIRAASCVIGGVTVFDYRAVRSAGVGYMYDSVSGELVGSAGAGAFVIGPDKTANLNGGGA